MDEPIKFGIQFVNVYNKSILIKMSKKYLSKIIHGSDEVIIQGDISAKDIMTEQQALDLFYSIFDEPQD